MSDTQEGPGWWLASNGKWYRPEQHPDYQASAPIPTNEAPSATPGRPVYLRKWFLIAAGVVVVLVIAGIAGGLSKKSSNPKSAALVTTPPTTAPSTTTPPVAAPSSTAPACPTGSPQANIAISAVPAPPGIAGVPVPGNPIWNVTLTGTVTNGSTAQIEFVTANVNVLGGYSPIPALVSPPVGTPFAILNPGESVSVSGIGGTVPIVSQTQPTLGPVTVTWNWPYGSPYFACPDGSG